MKRRAACQARKDPPGERGAGRDRVAAMVADPGLPLDRRAEEIRRMFAGVAGRYDLLNRLLSASLDRVWRRRAAEALDLPPGARVLDLCSGTGDQAVALRRRGARVVAADFCLPMLARSRGKFARQAPPRPRAFAADALRLPWRGASFDGAVVSFGLRNVADLDRALAELARVLRPGGRLAVLEFALPRRQPLRSLYLFYFRLLLPAIGRWVSRHGSAYTYLPASVSDFPQRETFLERLGAAGFDRSSWRDLSGGILCLYLARRRPEP